MMEDNDSLGKTRSKVLMSRGGHPSTYLRENRAKG